MKINKKVRYGLRVMIEIGTSTRPLLQKEIAEKQQISNKFLDQIIDALKNKNLIKNYKGKGSGYVLTLPPEDITIYDIYTAFDTLNYFVECLASKSTCFFSSECKSKKIWSELSETIISFLKNKKLNDLLT